MRKVTVAAIQMACSPDAAENRRTAEAMVRRAAGNGAQIILLPELFETPYFCQERRYASYELATTPAENPAIAQLRKVAAELQVVLPVSFYEKAGTALYNSIAIIDADGSVLGIYRKTHIPDDHFYQEKFYFTPGDTGFKVWNTRYARIGVGICWDQWFPEAARCMALAGAELLFYPTAIGSEPILEVDSAPHWQRCMQGHAAANLMPVIAANRIGTEHITPDEENQQQTSSLSFYGTSFLTDGTGAVLQQLGRDEAGIAMQTYDLDELEEMRMSWGVFRDRRPEYYRAPKGERLSSECETERLYEEQLHLELTAMRTLFVRVRVSLCFSFSSVGLALSGADAPAVPLFGFAIFPRPGEIFPKGGALGKEGKLFLYPLYSFALAIC